MARKQEQESASPEVSEVAKNVLRMQLPISMPGLGHVNCYALIDAEGAAVVDPGLPTNASWKALGERLRQAGLEVRHVHTVIVTHSHPDHFGGALRLHREAGARIVAHHGFGWGWGTSEEKPEVSVDDLRAQEEDDAACERAEGHDHPDDAAPEAAAGEDEDPDIERPLTLPRLARPTPWGGRGPRLPLRARLRYLALRVLGGGVLPKITHPVEHGDVLELAGREWFVLHTPGHTTDHICLHDPDAGTFAAGDHVLPSITPHIPGLTASPDPLKAFFYSLDRVAAIQGVENCLPAHGHPFTGLRERSEAIKRHHQQRLARVKAASREIGRPATVEEFSRKLFQKRSWGPMAESETYAHLEHLRHRGEAERFSGPDGKLRYTAG